MRTLIMLTSIILLSVGCKAKSNVTGTAKPEKVYRIVYEVMPNEWYQKQAELWEKEIEKNPKNEDAWYNYYNANRYAFFEDIEKKDKKALLQKIIDDMGKAIPGTYTFYLLKYWNSYDMKDMSLVEKAYSMNPDRPDTYYPFISHAAINGDEKQLKEFCDKLYKSRDIATWLYNYNYNVLMSTEPNAVLFSNGDNDTYPIWVLQQAKGIRTDVTLLNVSLCRVESYLKNQLDLLGIKTDVSMLLDKSKGKDENGQNQFDTQLLIAGILNLLKAEKPSLPVYFALTVYNQYIYNITDDLYMIGMAYRYSTERFDNLAILKKNFDNNLLLDYLKQDWDSEFEPGENLQNQMNLNYVPPMLLLGEHYQASGQTDKMQHLKELAITLAENSGKAELIEQINKKLH